MTDKINIKNNLTSMLSDLSIKFGDRGILIEAEKIFSKKIIYNEITYIQLEKKTNKLASSLNKIGLTSKDKAIIMIPMSIKLYITIIAVFKIGMTAVFIDPEMGLKQMVHCCNLTDPKAFFGIRKAHILRILSKSFRNIPNKIIVNDNPLINEFSLEKLIQEGSDNKIIEPISKDHTGLITFTSGSTGMPKGAARSHEFLKIQNKMTTKSLNYKKDDIELTAFPVFILNNLAIGIKSVIPFFKKNKLSKMDPIPIIKQIEDLNINRSVASPFFFETLSNYCIKNNIKLNSLKSIYTGGGPVKKDLIKKLYKISHAKVTVVYGSTEAEPISHIDGKSNLEYDKPGFCVGKPIDNIEVKIIKIQQGEIKYNKNIFLKDGEIGEIIVKGDHVNKDYYKNEQAIKENKIINGKNIWHRTGDGGYIDKNKYLWLMGRIKNYIIKNNKIIVPILLEYEINKIISIAESSLININNKNILFIELNKKKSVSKTIIKNQIQLIVKKILINIDEIKFIKKIPLDKRHNTKINYAELRKRYK